VFFSVESSVSHVVFFCRGVVRRIHLHSCSTYGEASVLSPSSMLPPSFHGANSKCEGFRVSESI
jgi:hypothetical protein